MGWPRHAVYLRSWLSFTDSVSAAGFIKLLLPFPPRRQAARQVPGARPGRWGLCSLSYAGGKGWGRRARAGQLGGISLIGNTR